MRTRVVMVLLGLAIILGADATPNGPLANLRDWTFDAYQRYWPGSRSTDRILVIEIDGDSLRHVGQWPWPRDKLARLVDLAATARVVGIDLLLTEPDRLTDGGNETDAILAASLRRVPVVLAAAADPAGESSGRPVPGTTPVFESGDDPRPDLPHYRSVFWPQAALAESAAGIGLVTVPAGADGILRRMPTVTSVGPLLIPSFAIEVVRVATRANRIGLRAEPAGGRTIKIGEGSIATDNSGGVWPRYSAAMVIPSVPAGRVLTGEIDPAVFRNRVVLIGASAPGLGDAFETPLRLPQSGVLIQAQLVESLLAGSLLLRPSFAPASERLLAVVLALAATFVFGRIRDRTYALLCGGAVILLAAGSFGAFAAAGLLLDATLPVTALLGTNLILLAERTHREVQAQREREVELTNALREAELRREAETARQSLTIALDAARMGMWDSDLIAGTSRCSARHDEIFGYAGPPSEWSRETLLGRVIAADRDLVSRSLDTAMATGTLHFQCRICRSDGSIRSIVVDGRVYHAGDGTPIRVAGVVADVTEQRHIEEALQRTQRLQAVGSLAGGVAHHFNNLLAVVLGNLDLAARPRPEIERIRPYLEAATAAAERGAKLTWQLLSFAGQQPLRSEPVAASGQLHDLAALIRETFPEDIAIETDIAADLWVVEIDSRELQLALLNLCFNARDAMPSGGSIRISAKNQTLQDDRLGLAGSYVAIDIADHGPGIPPEVLPRVFEPFITTKAVGAASGLGLSQVHGFVHQSGGAVDIASEPGRGTVVRMYLPAATAPAPAEASSSPEVAAGVMYPERIVENELAFAEAGPVAEPYQMASKPHAIKKLETWLRRLFA